MRPILNDYIFPNKVEANIDLHFFLPKSEEHIVLLSGQGSYPTQSIRSMAEYASRYEQGKLKKPNFDTIRKRLREFEEGNEPFC